MKALHFSRGKLGMIMMRDKLDGFVADEEEDDVAEVDTSEEL